jgi:hypothetical protein
MQNVVTVYMIQKCSGKGCENSGMEMFSAGKLYDTNDNMLLAMKRNEIYVPKWIINKIVAYTGLFEMIVRVLTTGHTQYT